MMSRNDDTIAPGATIQEAAEKMRTRYIHILVVQDKDRVMGTVSDRDLVVKAVAAGKNPDETQVREVMTYNRWFCFIDQSIIDAMRIMETRDVPRLAVLDRSRKVRGLVSAIQLEPLIDELDPLGAVPPAKRPAPRRQRRAV